MLNQTKKISVWPLLWIMLFDHTCLNITFPTLTLLFFDAQTRLFPENTTFEVRSMWYGLCLSIPHLVNIFVTPILSALSDELGRKRILLLGTFGALLFALTAAIGVFWGMLSLLFAGLIIKGAFSRTNPIAQAIMGDIAPKEKKVLYMGYLQTAISIGACVGPIIGGYFANQFFFNYLNFSLPYFIAAVFAGISCLFTIFFFQETLTVAHKQERKAFKLVELKNVLFHPMVVRISCILLLSQISWSAYYQFMPPILKTQLNFDAHALGLFIGLIALWLAIATGIGIKVLEYFFTFQQMLYVSLYLVLAGLILSVLFCYWHLAGLTSLLIWLAAVPTAIGDVIAFSCIVALYSDVVAQDAQGKVMGVCFIVVAVIWAITGVLGGFLMRYYELLPLIIAPIGILLSIVLLHMNFLKIKKA